MPWQRKQAFWSPVTAASAATGSGFFLSAATSLSTCAKKIGSRPPSPIGDQRHSPNGE
jgi:hypothetical protein